ncbi:Fasciclin-2 [Schistosoma japonicum]|uniref:Fasciclin-2 n=1 Tax=Schistosoma japonicum TaxID=6182 RepID=A0A4Z2DCL8_SCHJA|nr:Hemicentin-2 [Schistosoma japonicum]TNN14252.1 Fasciclin-2 [Schistosoma japonicum]
MKFPSIVPLLISIHNVYGINIKEADVDGNYYVQWEDNLALTCSQNTPSFEKANINWFLPFQPNKPVGHGNKAYVYRQDQANSIVLVLIVRSVTTDDSGIYTCRAGRQEGNQFIEMDRKSVNVIVRKSIMATNCPRDQWIPVSTEATNCMTNVTDCEELTAIVQCTIQAFPAPTIHWRFKGVQLTTGAKYIITTAGVTILNPTREDSGIYTVVARQPQQTAVFDLRVSGFSRPRITSGPSIVRTHNNTFVSGKEAYLQCLASGQPPPTIHWYHERDPQTELQTVNPRRFSVNTNCHVGLLRISEVIYPKDSGTYICRAVIPVPTTYSGSTSATITEAKIPIQVTLPPMLIPLTTMHNYVELGSTAIVQCRVRATTPLELYFKRFNSSLPYKDGVQTSDKRVRVWREIDINDPLNHDLFLKIENTTLDDTWNYSCHATNQGNSSWWNTTIHVMQTPQMLIPSELKTDNEQSKLRFGWRYKGTNLTCISRGMPHPSWTWYRRGEQILNGQNLTFVIISYDYWDHSQSWLQITPCLYTEHFIYDDYVCKATNIKGTNESNISFRRSSVPGQPTLESYSVSQSSLFLNVSPPIHTGGMPILTYELTYRAFGGPEGWYGPVTYPLDASKIYAKPKFELTGLLGNTNYQLKLFARSIVGQGTPYSFSVTTFPSTRPGPVEIIHSSTAIYPYGHIINWIPPMSGGSPILGYRIRVRSIDNDLDFRSMMENISPSSSWKVYTPSFNNPYVDYYHLAPLKPDQTYQLIVEAYNRHGYSLDGIAIQQYGYLNRTPTSTPQLQQIFPGERLNYQNLKRLTNPVNLLTNFEQSDLVPIWYLFKTPPADESDPPPLMSSLTSSLHKLCQSITLVGIHTFLVYIFY